MPLSSLNRVRKDRQRVQRARDGDGWGRPRERCLGQGFERAHLPIQTLPYFLQRAKLSARLIANPFAIGTRVLARWLESLLAAGETDGISHDGVPHAEALLNVTGFTNFGSEGNARAQIRGALVVSALASTPQTSSM